jgi:hypothetical protein
MNFLDSTPQKHVEDISGIKLSHLVDYDTTVETCAHTTMYVKQINYSVGCAL